MIEAIQYIKEHGIKKLEENFNIIVKQHQRYGNLFLPCGNVIEDYAFLFILNLCGRDICQQLLNL